jgi:hypothetical protein
MTGNKNLLFNFREYDTKQYVKVAKNERMEIIRDGSIIILSIIISNVLLVKNCASNLYINLITHKRIKFQTHFFIKKYIFLEIDIQECDW